MSKPPSNHTEFDEKLAALTSRIDATLAARRSTATDDPAAVQLGAIVAEMVELTPMLIEQLQGINESIYAELEARTPDMAANVERMEAADTPLLTRWFKLCQQLSQLDRGDSPSKHSPSKHDAVGAARGQDEVEQILADAKGYIDTLRKREELLMACHISAVQRDLGNASEVDEEIR